MAGIGGPRLDQQVPRSNYGFWFEHDVVRWQEFRPGVDTVSLLQLRIRRAGYPGDVKVELRDQSGAILWSSVVPESAFVIGAQWAEIVVDPPVSVIPEEPYQIYLSSIDPSPDPENRYFWHCDTESDYERGISSVESGWPGTDFSFKTFGGSECAAIDVSFSTAGIPLGTHGACS